MAALIKSNPPGPVPYLHDEHLTPGVKAFLQIVNSGRPMEGLPIPAARQALIDAQKAYAVDYSGIEESERVIEADGFTLKLNVVRPKGPGGNVGGPLGGLARGVGLAAGGSTQGVRLGSGGSTRGDLAQGMAGEVAQGATGGLVRGGEGWSARDVEGGLLGVEERKLIGAENGELPAGEVAKGAEVVAKAVAGEVAKGVVEDLPAFIFVHGGGWVLGDYPTHKRLVRDLVVESGLAAVFVNYTLAPEAHYPQAINELYAATKWVAAHGAAIGVDGSRLAVVGNSAGGNMTGAIGLMAKEQKGPEIKCLVLMWPATDATFTERSYELYGADRFLTTPLMKWSWDQYTSDLKARREIHASLLNATVEQLRGLPPVLIQVAENDILRDEGEAFGRKLVEAGVVVTSVRYNGMIHDWGMSNGLANEPATKSLIRHAAAELRHYLK